MKQEPRLVVPLKPKAGEVCPIADSYACVQICPLWMICQSEGSPWKCEDEDVPGNDADE